MTPKIIVFAFALLAAVLWIGFNQARLERKLANLQAQNQQFALELSNRPVSALDGLKEAQARLAETELALNLAEQRLSALTAQLNSMQRRPQPMSRAPYIVEPMTRFTPVEHSPASSHSPNGELLSRGWGPEQLLGPPNTTQAGDISTAWASRNPDGGEEWLKLEYPQAVDLAEVRVRETYHPGAIVKVTAFFPNGQEVTLWEGRERAAQAPTESSFPVNGSVRASSVKIYLDTRLVPGWNEIDAVELVGRDGSRQWATSATASSTFAEQ